MRSVGGGMARTMPGWFGEVWLGWEVQAAVRDCVPVCLVVCLWGRWLVVIQMDRVGVVVVVAACWVFVVGEELR